MRKLKVLDRNYRITGEKFPALVYGLGGIMQIFGVSKSTAKRYKDTFLKDAVTQKGKVIVVDTAKALRCFGVVCADDYVNVSDDL